MPSAIGDVQARGEEAGGQALLTSASQGCSHQEESFGAFRNATLRDGFASGDSRSGAQGTRRVEGRAAREQGCVWREMGEGITLLELVWGKGCRGTPHSGHASHSGPCGPPSAFPLSSPWSCVGPLAGSHPTDRSGDPEC